MTWKTQLPNFEEFRRASRRPERTYLTGYLRGVARAMTLASLMDEFDHAWVEGPNGWRAEVWREGRRIKVTPAKRRPRPYNGQQTPTVRNIRAEACPTSRRRPMP